MPVPELVVVTSPFTYTYPGVQDAIAIIRTAFPRVPVWLGGIYAQLCPEHARRHAGADAVITKADLSAFVARLAAIFPHLTVPPHQFAHIADWPAPALDLYPALSYIPLRLSRGCVNTCAYCAAPYLCPHFEERDAERAAAELLAFCARTGARDIAFYDDALLANAERRLLPFVRRVCAVRRDLRWHTPNGMHLRLITDELAGVLRAAGFVTLRFGLESANYARIVSTGAKYAQRDVARCVHALLRAGFDPRTVGLYILMGLPGQSLEEVRDTICFVRDTCGITAKLAEYAPVPHSALWSAAVADSTAPLADEPLWHNNSLLPLRSRVFTSDAIAELRALAAR